MKPQVQWELVHLLTILKNCFFVNKRAKQPGIRRSDQRELYKKKDVFLREAIDFLCSHPHLPVDYGVQLDQARKCNLIYFEFKEGENILGQISFHFICDLGVQKNFAGSRIRHPAQSYERIKFPLQYLLENFKLNIPL